MCSTNSRRVFHRGFRASVMAAAALLALPVGAAGITSARAFAAITRETPRATFVAPGRQMERAALAAAAIPGATACWGVGGSMAPLYPERTAVVVAPVKFAALKRGMTVVYVDRGGHTVAHALVGDLPQGWVAQGVNNDWEDDDLVTPQNLLGVIVRAYAPRET